MNETITVAREPAPTPDYAAMPAQARQGWFVGMPPVHSQWLYRATIEDRRVGWLQAIDLTDLAGFAFVTNVLVDSATRRRGVASALHRALLADFGTLAVEDYCSASEYLVLCKLAREFTAGERDVESLGIVRTCVVVTRAWTLSAGIDRPTPA